MKIYYLGSKSSERFDEDSCLGVDVRAANNFGTRQWFVLLGFVPQSHDAWHLLLSNLNLASSVGGLLYTADTKVLKACRDSVAITEKKSIQLPFEPS